MGFGLSVDYLKMFESWLLTLIIIGLISFKKKNPSNLIFFFLLIITYIPIASIYWLKDEARIYFFSITIGFLISIFVVKFTPRIYIKNIFKDNTFFYLIVSLASFVSLTCVIIFNGIPDLSALNFNIVYEIRGDFNYGFGFMNYLLTWQVWVINIYLILHFLLNKKYKLIFIPVFIQFFIYLSTGHKTYLFLMLAIPFLFYMINKKFFYAVLLLAINSLILISWIEFNIVDTPWITSLFTNRLLFLPSQISFQYYEFFSNNELMLLTHSLFSLFGNSGYSIHPIQIIGIVYYGGNWPNTGYFGDAYMNFGIVGIFVFSMLFGFLLVIFDSFALKNNLARLVKVMSVLFVMYFTSGGLLTSLLNGGILLLLLLLFIYNNRQVKI
jgi:oligosaccharide repeat unit polymerase